MSQWVRTDNPVLLSSNQYLPLSACPPSLALISLQDSAGTSGTDPRGTGKENSHIIFQRKFTGERFHYDLTSIPDSANIISFSVRHEIFRPCFLGTIVKLTHRLGIDVIKTLTGNLLMARLQALISEWYINSFKHVSLKHHPRDRIFSSASWTLLSGSFLK